MRIITSPPRTDCASATGRERGGKRKGRGKKRPRRRTRGLYFGRVLFINIIPFDYHVVHGSSGIMYAVGIRTRAWHGVCSGRMPDPRGPRKCAGKGCDAVAAFETRSRDHEYAPVHGPGAAEDNARWMTRARNNTLLLLRFRDKRHLTELIPERPPATIGLSDRFSLCHPASLVDALLPNPLPPSHSDPRSVYFINYFSYARTHSCTRHIAARVRFRLFTSGARIMMFRSLCEVRQVYRAAACRQIRFTRGGTVCTAIRFADEKAKSATKETDEELTSGHDVVPTPRIPSTGRFNVFVSPSQCC